MVAERNKRKMPRSVENKRKSFFATDNEQSVIRWLREFGWNPIVTDSVTRSVQRELETYDRKKAYLIQEGKQSTQEFEDIVLGLGQLEIFYHRWSEYMKELKSANK